MEYIHYSPRHRQYRFTNHEGKLEWSTYAHLPKWAYAWFNYLRREIYASKRHNKHRASIDAIKPVAHLGEPVGIMALQPAKFKRYIETTYSRPARSSLRGAERRSG